MCIGPYFLSRLCGGEFHHPMALSTRKFLSRLCGGEFINHVDKGGPIFLSRLCGGELSKATVI